MKRHIPNIITLGNLTCGILSILSASKGSFEWSAYFIFLGLFLDFFDGFFARILKVDGEIGKQLDSLADMITFGVAPGFLVLFFCNEWLTFSDDFIVSNWSIRGVNSWGFSPNSEHSIPAIAYLALTIPLLSCVRLAKFNVSTNQTDQFIGLPTPANAILLSSLVLVMLSYAEFIFSKEGARIELPYWLLGISVISSLLLNIKTPLIALKFKTFGWKGNEARFVLLGVSLLVILGSLLISNIFVAVPIIILLYLIISVINNFTKRAK